MIRLSCLMALAPLLVSSPACAAAPSEAPPLASDSLRLESVAKGLDFPTHLTAPAGDSSRLFITEKSGRIRIVRDGMLVPEPFLDLREAVSTGGERGLLSLAFHPRYAENGRFFVYLTDPEGSVRVVEYRVSSDPDRADPSSGRTLLTIPQPFANHNGGLALFGPDGFLYLGIGDGGSGGDPLGHGQNPETLLGALLRIDVDRREGELSYGIPRDNPFVGDARGRDEIWAYGLRNPWRFAFDRESEALYIADVGQNAVEEVNAQPVEESRGANYGWNSMEGTRCFPRDPCVRSGLVLPALEYTHDDGCSVTGGPVYRGKRIPTLEGHYLYGDFCGGWVRSFRLQDGRAVEPRDWTAALGEVGRIVSFGEDAAGEVYILTAEGNVYRLAPPA